MVVWLDSRPDLAHNTILINQEGVAVDAQVLFAIHALLTVGTIESRNGCISIREQWKGQAILFCEFLVRVHIIRTHSEYNSPPFLDLVIGVAEAASLFCTAWCVVPRVEI